LRAFSRPSAGRCDTPEKMGSIMRSSDLSALPSLRSRAGLLAAALAWVAFAEPAKATDEIQVYNADIAVPGQFTIQQYLNYVGLGLKQPPFPGGLVSNGSLNGTPELAYGVTDWWEVGLYLPFAIQDQQFLSDAFKLRTLFVVPQADKRDVFYGVHFEFSNTTPKFSQSRFALEKHDTSRATNTRQITNYRHRPPTALSSRPLWAMLSRCPGQTPPSRRRRADRSIQCHGRRREWRSPDNDAPSPLRFPAIPRWQSIAFRLTIQGTSWPTA
jgi:hypothetical protein